MLAERLMMRCCCCVERAPGRSLGRLLKGLGSGLVTGSGVGVLGGSLGTASVGVAVVVGQTNSQLGPVLPTKVPSGHIIASIVQAMAFAGAWS